MQSPTGLALFHAPLCWRGKCQRKRSYRTNTARWWRTFPAIVAPKGSVGRSEALSAEAKRLRLAFYT
eukprot:1196024-Prorocentrum_minimum.AAC.3